MPISTSWYDEEHRVIHQKFEGNWSWDELGEAQVAMRTLAASVPYHLILFTDMSGTKITPKKGNLLAQGRSGLANVPENVTHIIMVMLLVLLVMGLKRRDFYLAVGDLNATAEPSPRGIPRKPESWRKFGRNYALISVGLLLIFMVPAFQPVLSNLSIGLLLFAALCATMNAFAEEFLYRSALLPQVLPLFGKNASLLLVPLWFGLAHYFGVPNGITGVIITAIGGWFFAKSIIETRGMGWAWFLHFLADFTVYLVLMLARQL